MVSTVGLHCHMTGQTLDTKHINKIITDNSNTLNVKTIKILQKVC